MKYDAMDKYIGEYLRDRRQALNMPLTLTAEKFGMSKQRLRNYEIGRCSLPFDLFTSLCNLYGIDPVALFQEASDYMRRETFKCQ